MSKITNFPEITVAGYTFYAWKKEYYTDDELQLESVWYYYYTDWDQIHKATESAEELLEAILAFAKEAQELAEEDAARDRWLEQATGSGYQPGDDF